MNMIIGLGTGRCGSVSLSLLLSQQQSCYISHENNRARLLPWVIDSKRFEKYYHDICNRDPQNNWHGDVAYYNLPYVRLYLERNPETKFIVLRREKEQVVNSFCIKTEAKEKKWNHWQHIEQLPLNKKWFETMPTYPNQLTKKEALNLYYDEYYKLCDMVIPERNRYDITTSDLNVRQECIKMLKFCGFDKPKWSKRHANSNK